MRVETLDKYIEIRPCSRDKLSRDSNRSNPWPWTISFYIRAQTIFVRPIHRLDFLAIRELKIPVEPICHGKKKKNSFALGFVKIHSGV